MGQGSAVGRRIEDVVDVRDLREKPLGKGSFGSVWRARSKSSSGHTVAVKALDKTKMQALKVSPKQIQSEVDFMRECAGRKEFVQLYDFVEAPRRYYLILEYCDGGTLERTAKEGSKLGDNQVARLMRQMLQGLAFLHAKNIIHRDVKPHNAFLVGQVSSERVNVKLGDFGIAARLQPGRLLRDKTGSLAFMAPEMHLLPSKSLGYNHKVDMWAIGTVMVFLIAHEYAFVDESGRLMRDELIRGDLPIWEADFFSSLFERVQSAAGLGSRRPSPIARDLVQKLLAPNPCRRLSATAALEHDWFRHPVLAADMRVVDDMPLLLWEDFRDVIGTDKLARKIPEMAAWVADTCGLDELVDMISTPLNAATKRARSAGRGRKGSLPKSSGKGDKPSGGSGHRRRSSRAPHERAKLLS